MHLCVFVVFAIVCVLCLCAFELVFVCGCVFMCLCDSVIVGVCVLCVCVFY